MAKIRIGILGVGGVGGYYGGLLAKKFHDSETVEIVFIVRPETGSILKQSGLKLQEDTQESIIHPSEIITNPIQCKPLDFLICCTKGYHLEEAISALPNAINSNTIILPLLNGVNASGTIKRIYPQAEVWEGCVYIVASIVTKGVVLVKGATQKLFFGSVPPGAKRLVAFSEYLKEAGIHFECVENIEEVIWKKYIFISSLATITTQLDLSITEMLNNPEHRKTVLKMLEELHAIAKAKGLDLGENIINETIANMEKVPAGSLTSMLRDYRAGQPLEVAALTEFVIKLGRELNVATPIYSQIYHGILNNLLIKKYIKLDK